jgi:hypothetical protein
MFYIVGRRLNLGKTGKEQFRGCVGVVDSANTEWESEYKNVIDLVSSYKTFYNRNYQMFVIS